MANLRVRCWCFTVNNYTEKDEEGWAEFAATKCSYLTYGREVGDSGTPHLQGYMEMTNRLTRRSTISTWFRNKGLTLPHLEAKSPRSTVDNCVDYCHKDGDFYELGSPKMKHVGQGKRTDIEVVRDAIVSGDIKSEWDLLNSVSSLAAFKFGSVYLNNMVLPASRDPPIVFWLHGPTGCGKSRASAEFVDKFAARGWNYWRANQGLAWFDGYNRQEVAWFDDFRFSGKQSDYAFLLNITDRYPLRVPVKGNFVVWMPKVIIFTGPLPIATAFSSLPESDSVAQFVRRVTHEYDFAQQGGEDFASSMYQFLEPSVVDENEIEIDNIV